MPSKVGCHWFAISWVRTRPRDDGLRPTLFVTLATPLDDNQILLAQRIDQHLAEQIPSHMLPSQLHVLPALPRNDNGKLARAELRHLADTLYHDNLPEERAC